MATPHVFPAFLSPIASALDRLRPYVTDLKLLETIGEKLDMESWECPKPPKKTGDTLKT
jgi:hypothetical protein